MDRSKKALQSISGPEWRDSLALSGVTCVMRLGVSIGED